MTAALIVLALALIQVDTTSRMDADGSWDPGSRGVVSGRVLDARCGGPIAYANVIVDGTKLGAMSLKDGSYQLAGLPPGQWRIRATMMGFETREAAVTVIADSVAVLDLALDAIPVTRTRPPRPPGTRRCEVHDIEMHAVTVLLSYGLRVEGVDDAAERGFPNADPSGPDDPVGRLSAEPVTTWVYRCEECARARNEWLNDGTWIDLGGAPKDWGEYAVDGVVVFRAPQGMAATVVVGDCVTTREWTGHGIRIRARYGLRPHLETFARADMNGDVIVGDSYPHIALWKRDDGSRTLGASFRAPPVGTRVLHLEIEVTSDDMLETAGAVVNSVRFE